MKAKLLLMLPLLFVMQWCWGQKKASIKRMSLFKEEKTATVEPTLFWAQYDATRRGSMIFIDANQRIRVLSENPPDAALEKITAITAKVKEIKGVGEVEAAFNAQKSIADLAKRTAAVNMLRDALYRLNELYYATVDEKQEILKQLSKSNAINIRTDGKSIDISSMALFRPTLSNNDIKCMFLEVIKCTKEIAKEEARTELEAEKTKAEQAKAEVEKYKALQNVIEKADGKLSKVDALKFLEKL